VDVDLHIAAELPRAGLEQERGVEKVGPGLKVPLARVEHGDRFAAGQHKRGRTVVGVEPEALEVTLGPMKAGAVVRVGLAHGRRLRSQQTLVLVRKSERSVIHFERSALNNSIRTPNIERQTPNSEAFLLFLRSASDVQC
jgi:hypothetical protein